MRHQQFGYSRALQSRRVQLLAVGVCTLALVALWPSGPADSSSTLQPVQLKEADSRVLVELFVMSQCPDGQFCENAFAPILKKLQPLVTVRTQYIATLSEDKSKVKCMHGENECQGNLLQLCLGQHVPVEKNFEWFYSTLQCHTAGSVFSKDHLKSCMSKASIPAEVQAKILQCADSDEGKQLQLKSAQEVVKREVKKSCTVYIAGKKRCIRDGGRWYDCPAGDSQDSFIKTICDAHTDQTGKRAPECPAPAAASPAAANATAN